MSELTECSMEDDLEQIDKQVQLVSTSSDSSHMKDDNINKMDVEEEKVTIDTSRQSCDSNDSISKTDLKPKLHNSCNNLYMVPVDAKFDIKYPKTKGVESSQNKKNKFKRSASCISLISGEKSNPRRKYDHVQSKVKQYFKNHSVKTESPPAIPKTPKNIVEDKPVNKEEYLEEINKRLKRELDEKNAILTKLQENYEQLLFKYAEAQNRIDQLRFKAINGSAENTSRSGFKPKSSRTSIRIPLNSFYNSNDFPDSKDEDGKCQKAIVAPFMKNNDSENKSEIINRPSSLPIDSNLKVVERDALKAATPTDSEGVSSVITSMSGHSKILNTLDEENDKKSKLQYRQNSEFILEDHSVSNDPFDKVKNWQNSLPPLEQIETPDTALYDVPQDPDISLSTNYNEISPCNINKNPLIDDTFPCWHEKGPELHRSRSDYQKNKAISQAVMKKYLRTLSLPGSLTRRNLMSIIYKRKNHHTIDATASPMRSDFNEEELKNYQNNENQMINSPKIMPKNDIPSSCIIQPRKKKPPLLRCSSLPAYDYDSPKSGSGRNPGLYIPPLDLENLTLSDDESSPQLDCYLSKSNLNTSPSFLTSRSMDCSFQTLQSGKATISEFSDSQFVRPTRPIFRLNKLDFSGNNVCSPGCGMYRGEGDEKSNKGDSKNWCNVCGETITGQNFPYRSNSFQSVQEIKDPIAKSSVRRTRYPFNRSVSFNSENNSPSYCYHNEDEKMFSPYRERSNDSLEKFDIYANNLKARSQVIMKALTAHVNNS